MTVYDIEVTDNRGATTTLAEYSGKVLLIANTATRCGFTPQYEGLQDLQNTFSEKGFEVLDFPCNQFLGQAPGSDAEIEEFCTRKFQTVFRRFAKVDVNGADAHPLFTYLKAAAAGSAVTGRGLFSFGAKKSSAGPDIKWNFTKFLVDRKGNVVARFGPMTKPRDIETAIAALL